MRSLFLFLLFSTAGTTVARAQGQPLGSWRSHYPHYIVTSVATDGTTVYAAADQGFFSHNTQTGETITHSKVDGMSDAGCDKMGYDATTGTALVSYTNGNLDLYRGGSFFNIPFIKLRTAAGNKQITDIYADGGTAWVSSGIGALVLDLQKQEIKETYNFTLDGEDLPIKAIRPFGAFLFAATARGLYRAPKTGKNLQDFANSWTRLDSSNVQGLTATPTQLWAYGPAGALRLNAANTLDTVLLANNAVHIDVVQKGVALSRLFTAPDGAIFGRVQVLDEGANLIDSVNIGYPGGAVTVGDGTYWIADRFGGLAYRKTEFSPPRLVPSGPASSTTYDMDVRNRELYLVHGGFNDNYVPIGIPGSISYLPAGSFDWKTSQPFGNARDLVASLRNEDGSTWYGSMQDGLFLLKADGSTEKYAEDALEPWFDIPGQYGVQSMVRDLAGNLIIGQYKATTNEIAVRTPAGQWYHYTADGAGFAGGLPRSVDGLLIDDFGQKWWFQPQGGGVFVYDDNNTPENIADDKSINVGAGVAPKGLPSAKVLCLVKDREGSIWAGTDKGIGIFNCPGSVISRQCEAEQRIVQYDNFAGYLFEAEQVKVIAVDGANRKWIGTNNGVWLISPDAQQILLRFTIENSPLPSNSIRSIVIDEVTGDVYIGTSNGLVSYRGDATTGSNEEVDLVSFPNPVASGYNGPIAITGLPENADVRITDISGQLVFKTQSAGGQATWNGRDYTGKRAASGVYLIFATNRDGSQTRQGKLVFIE